MYNAGIGNQTIPFKTTAPAFGYGASVLFVPGWTFLGATYSAAVVQGAYISTAESGANPPFTSSGANAQLANTNFTPIDLSWSLGHGWFVAGAFTVVGPDGSQYTSTMSSVNLNPDYWTFAPGVAISYLDANWLVSANFRYDIGTASKGVTMNAAFVPGASNGYISGNELFGDFTWLYKVGKWQFGPVGYFEAQTTADSPGGGITCAGTPGLCGYQSQVAVGALVGYDFGPVAMQAWFDDTVECANAVCGLDVWFRTSFRLLGAGIEADRGEVLIARTVRVFCVSTRGPRSSRAPFRRRGRAAFKPVFNGAEHALRCRHVDHRIRPRITPTIAPTAWARAAPSPSK